MEGTRALWLLSLGLLCHAATATLTMPTQLFGEQWIAANGVTTRQFRFYIAQDGSTWEGWGKDVEVKRAQFRSEMQQVLANFLEVNLWRISFVSDKLPARSWLRVPDSRQRDPRSYVDVTIDYPADNQFNKYPWDITTGANWVIGGTTDVSFPAKWGIGATACDPLDPDYAFTEPFPQGGMCDRKHAECVAKYPLCNRVVEIFTVPAPTPALGFNISLNADYWVVFNNFSKVDFAIQFSASAQKALMAAMPDALGVTIEVISISPGSIIVGSQMYCEKCDSKRAHAFISYAAKTDSSMLLGNDFCNKFGVDPTPPDNNDNNDDEESSHEHSEESSEESSQFDPYECPHVRGYVGLHAMDHKGDTIQSFDGKSLRKLARKCDKDCSCQAFTSYGDLKSSSVADTTAPVDVCFYVRLYPCDQGQCQDVHGYSWIAGRDHEGKTIGFQLGDVNAVANACSQDCACQGFNSWGFLLSDATDNMDAPDMCLYSRDDPCDGCREVDGYKAKYGLNVDGQYNLQQVIGTLGDIADACDEDDDCVAFNAEGWLKSSTQTVDNPGMCLYFKHREEPCDFMDGYKWQYGASVDHQYDLPTDPNSGLEDLAAACSQNPDCQAFVLGDDGGRLKSSDQPIPSKDSCLYIKDEDPCPQAFGFSSQFGFSVDAQFDLEAINGGVQEVAQMCAATPDCVAFVQVNKTWGVLKSLDDRIPSPGTCLYLKGQTACPHIDGYLWQYNATIDDQYDIDTINGMPEDVPAACDQNPDCKGFVLTGPGNGTLKSSNNTIPSDGSVCTYLKDNGCPNVDGYHWLGNVTMDARFDFQTIEGGPQDVGRACLMTPACRGFVMNGPHNGTLKLSNETTSSNGSVCTYIKDVQCPDAFGYRWRGDVSVDAQYDLGPATGGPEDIAVACDANPSCVAFTLDGPGNGTLKSSNQTVTSAGPACTYLKDDTLCPQREGYDVVVGYDIDSKYNLFPSTGTLENLALGCDNFDACMAFVPSKVPGGQGWFKTSEQLIPSPGSCVYLKGIRYGCPYLKDFLCVGNVTVAGHDILELSGERIANLDIAAACIGDANCTALVLTGPGHGILKASNQTSPANVNVCTYLRQRNDTGFGGCSGASIAFTRQEDVTIDDKYNIRAVRGAATDLSAACDQDDNCQAFVMLGTSLIGVLKSSNETIPAPQGACTYFYQNYATKGAPCQDVPNYSWWLDEDVDSQYNLGQNLGQADNLPYLAYQCNNDPNCQAFTNQGQLKSSGAAYPNPGSGTCLYIKNAYNDCEQVSGYAAYKWRDHPENTIQHVTTTTDVSAFGALCDNQCDCLGFNADGDLKYNAIVSPGTTNKCFYLRTNNCQGSFTCADINGYYWQYGANFQNKYVVGQEHTSDPQILAAACDANDDCKAFNRFGQLGNSTKVYQSPGMCTYFKGVPLR